MNSQSIAAYVAGLEQDKRNLTEALRVAHDTIQQKQAALEERPDMSEEVARFLADIEWVFTGWESAINKEGSTVTSGLRELDSLYRKLWPVGSKREEGAA